MTYKTKGVCASHIEFEVDDNKKVHNVRFIGGCSGNTQGVASLVEGMDAEEVISRLKGIKCGFKNTSCPDQLSTALEEVLNKQTTVEILNSYAGDRIKYPTKTIASLLNNVN